jgi:hypothetical protein
MAAMIPEVAIIQAPYEIDRKLQLLDHHFHDGLHDRTCDRFQQITFTPEIQDGGCETGNIYKSGAVSDK